jgi:hypothetical protein
MSEIIARSEWPEFLRSYTQKNNGRPTRLGVFEKRDGFFDDYWLEDGLRLIGVDVDQHDDRTRIEIVLENYTHSVGDANEVRFINNPNTGEEGLDILEKNESTTVLRFENVKTS